MCVCVCANCVHTCVCVCVCVCALSVGQRPAAIVSPHAGTTRDVLESALDICGYPVILRCTEIYWNVF